MGVERGAVGGVGISGWGGKGEGISDEVAYTRLVSRGSTVYLLNFVSD